MKEQLKQYIEEAQARGYSDREIRSRLITSGWHPNEVYSTIPIRKPSVWIRGNHTATVNPVHKPHRSRKILIREQKEDRIIVIVCYINASLLINIGEPISKVGVEGINQGKTWHYHTFNGGRL